MKEIKKQILTKLIKIKKTKRKIYIKLIKEN